MALFSVKDEQSVPDWADFVFGPTALDVEDFSLIRHIARGGVAINGVGEGLNFQNWVGLIDGEDDNEIVVFPEMIPEQRSVVVSETAPITEMTFTFDQNMQPAVAYVVDGVAKFKWFDTQANEMTTTIYPDISSPYVFHDDVRDNVVRAGISDIILLYFRDNRLKKRIQRDRYGVEYDLYPRPSGANRIIHARLNVHLRVQIQLGRRVR